MHASKNKKSGWYGIAPHSEAAGHSDPSHAAVIRSPQSVLV